MANVEPTAVILCDDVRREDNGKQFAIGIYGSEVIVPSFPSILRFSLLVRIGFTGAGKQSIKFRIQSVNGGKQEIGAELETTMASKEWIGVPLQPMVFEAPTTLSILFESPPGKWKKLHSVPIRVGPLPIASPLQP